MDSQSLKIHRELERRREARKERNERAKDSSQFPFQEGDAFLGYMDKCADVDCHFDGRKLVCWVKWWHYAQVGALGIIFGPFGTVVLASGAVKTNKWYLWAALVVVNIGGWAALIESIRTRASIVFDIVTRQAEFYRRRSGAPFFTMDLNQAKGVETESFYRPIRAQVGMYARVESPSDCRGAVVACHTLALRIDDQRLVTILETTDSKVVCEVRDVINKQLDLPVHHNGPELDSSRGM